MARPPAGRTRHRCGRRYHRMKGENVLHAMGYDAFGLPAEQYAVQTGQHPRITTEQNIANMRRQLHRMGLSFDNRRSFATIDPGYVRWTQWIFSRIYDYLRRGCHQPRLAQGCTPDQHAGGSSNPASVRFRIRRQAVE